jgi:hypothetical protein
MPCGNLNKRTHSHVSPAVIMVTAHGRDDALASAE